MSTPPNGHGMRAVDGYELRPLPAVSRQKDVADQIKLYIERNGLVPGDRLPGESWFAQSLQVGRPLIREALKGLEAVGAVEARKGVGRFVGAFEAEAYLRHFTAEVLIQSFSERELTEARCHLEIAAVGEAVRRLTENDVGELRRLLETMREQIARGEAYTEADIGMHRVLMGRVDNRLIAAMLDAMYALGVVHRQQRHRPGAPEIDLAEHEAIYRAVLTRDGRLVRSALMAHFETTAKRLGFTPHWREIFAPESGTE